MGQSWIKQNLKLIKKTWLRQLLHWIPTSNINTEEIYFWYYETDFHKKRLAIQSYWWEITCAFLQLKLKIASDRPLNTWPWWRSYLSKLWSILSKWDASVQDTKMEIRLKIRVGWFFFSIFEIFCKIIGPIVFVSHKCTVKVLDRNLKPNNWWNFDDFWTNW